MDGAAVPRKGAFIVLEGIDNSGKTRLSEALAQRIESDGGAVLRLRFPDRATAIGGLLNGYLSKTLPLADESLHLLMSADRWQKRRLIEAALSEGKTVICDRYCYSGVAYSWAKNNPRMDARWCKACDAGMPQPDLVLFLDLDPAIAQARDSFGEEIYEKCDFQKKVRERYHSLCEADALDPNERTWTVVDASRPFSLVFEDALFHVISTQHMCATGLPISRLWALG